MVGGTNAILRQRMQMLISEGAFDPKHEGRDRLPLVHEVGNCMKDRQFHHVSVGESRTKVWLQAFCVGT